MKLRHFLGMGFSLCWRPVLLRVRSQLTFFLLQLSRWANTFMEILNTVKLIYKVKSLGQNTIETGINRRTEETPQNKILSLIEMSLTHFSQACLYVCF